MKSIKFAVIGDLHCQSESDLDDSRRESFLIAGVPRVPSQNHPVQSLFDIETKFKTDIVICTGDISNKSSSSGLSHGWDLLRYDIKEVFNAEIVLPTIGNHDVNSRSKDISPFDVAKNIHPNFPFSDNDAKNSFWNNGFYLYQFRDTSSVLILNTTHDHYNEKKALRGTFSSKQIQSLDKYLKNQSLNPIRIANMHHHPILHSFVDYGSNDVLEFGDQLLKVLSKHKFNFVIHGHRHQPRIQRYIDGGNPFHIFGSGSFSASLADKLYTRTRNVFHLIELKTENTNKVSGSILTWEYNFGIGWNPTTKQSAEFPHFVSINSLPTVDLATKIKKFFNSNKNKKMLINSEMKCEIPEVQMLLPNELEELQSEIKTEMLQLEIDHYGFVKSIGRLEHVI